MLVLICIFAMALPSILSVSALASYNQTGNKFYLYIAVINLLLLATHTLNVIIL